MIKPYTFILTTASLLLFTGCSNPMSSAAPRIVHKDTVHTDAAATLEPQPIQTSVSSKEAKFHSAMIAVAKSTKTDPRYRKLGLQSHEEKIWFKDLMYKLWDRQITRQDFIRQGVQKYPDHRYEFTYIANAYQNY
jgi:hypothetical protein